MKLAIIIDEGADQFALEYPDTLGRKSRMRLDATTYERALREARRYLSISTENIDEAGDQWVLE